MNDNKGMSEIVKTMCSIIEGFIFLFGMYIIFFGHLTPGGGFAGGVILSGGFVLMLLSYGKNSMSKKAVGILENSGALIFILGAFLGMLVMKVFFANFIHRLWGSQYFRFLSSGNIVIYNFAIGLKVMAELYGIVYILSITHVFIKKNGGKAQ